ncbi:MAG: oligosaccharide flippase family protein [Candidatus Magasanikbacteria bacterium]|nr:oligosaccharide flippase family protein [Candidatus Magasanikbacteria bacterium]
MIKLDGNNSAATVVRGVTIFGIGSVIIRIIDFIIAILILRWLSIFEFGLYRLALSAQDLFSGFFLSGLDNVIVSDVSRGLQKDVRAAKILYTTFLGFISAIGFLLWSLFFFGNNIFLSKFGITSESAKIISFLFLLAPLETIYNLKFSILLDFGWGTAYRIARDFSRLGSLVVFLSYFSLGIEGALWSLVFARLLPLSIILIFYHRDSFFILPNIFEVKNSLKILFFEHGKWALLDDFVMNIGKNIRPFIIRYFAGVEAVAIFSVAQNLLAHSSSLFPIRDVLTPIFPRMADKPDQLISKINRSAKYSVWAHFAVAIAAAMGAPILVYLFFP